MSTIRGCSGKVYIGGGPTQIAEVTEISIDAETEAEDVSVMGTCSSDFDAGKDNVTGSITAFYNRGTGATDPAPDAGQALVVKATKVDIKYRPNGDGVGKPEVQVDQTLVTKIGISGSVNGRVGVSFDFVGGTFTETTQ